MNIDSNGYFYATADIPKDEFLFAVPCTQLMDVADLKNAIEKLSNDKKKIENECWHSTWNNSNKYIRSNSSDFIRIWRPNDAKKMNVRFVLTQNVKDENKEFPLMLTVESIQTIPKDTLLFGPKTDDKYERVSMRMSTI